MISHLRLFFVGLIKSLESFEASCCVYLSLVSVFRSFKCFYVCVF
jgi:hypothetical protein